MIKPVSSTAANIGIAKNRADLHFISHTSLVIKRSNFHNSSQLLLLTSSINYKSGTAPGKTFNEYPAFSNTYRWWQPIQDTAFMLEGTTGQRH
jgi:hypothetical protein